MSLLTPLPVDLRAAEASYPLVFEHLRAAGWTASRAAPLPPEEAALGFVRHAYADAFLRSFHEIQVKHPVKIGPRTSHRGFRVGFGPALRRMDPPSASVYVDRIAGTSFVYPVMSFEDCVVFALEDGRALAVDEVFRGCIWTRDPFQMMHWALFKERLEGVEMRELTMHERPLDYRW